MAEAANASASLHAGRIARIGWLVILLAFGGIGSWLMLAPLHGAVVIAGQVKVHDNRKTVQHGTGGIVKEILVGDGDLVAEGQPLILLEDSQVGAVHAVTRTALDVELARHARLEAEMTGRAIVFPGELVRRAAEPAVADLMQREQILLDERRHAVSAQIALMEQQIGQIGRETDALSGQMNAEKTAMALAREELDSFTALKDRNFVSKPRVLEQKRLVAEYLSRAEERRADIARALRQRDELRLRIAALRNDQSRVAAEEAKTSSARILELQDRLRPAEDALERLSIRSPVAGRVLDLRVHTRGATLGPREPLLEIVPAGVSLFIEGRAALDAIKELSPGQHADIRFTALPYRSTPLVAGRVSYISPDALTDPRGASFYVVRIEPDAEAMRVAGIPALQPGMAAEVYVRTRERTAIEYLLQPVTETLLRAFRER